MKSFDLIFLGDSLTAGNAWQRAFPDHKIFNAGINGDNCAGVWARLDHVTRKEPRCIFLMIGINDFLQGASPKDIAIGQERILQEFLEKIPQTKIYVQSLLPYLETALPGLSPNLMIIETNELLREQSEKMGLTFIDLFSKLADENHQIKLDYTSDGLHLTDLGYRLWEKTISPLTQS